MNGDSAIFGNDRRILADSAGVVGVPGVAQGVVEPVKIGRGEKRQDNAIAVVHHVLVQAVVAGDEVITVGVRSDAGAVVVRFVVSGAENMADLMRERVPIATVSLQCDDGLGI